VSQDAADEGPQRPFFASIQNTGNHESTSHPQLNSTIGEFHPWLPLDPIQATTSVAR
jgi:hypothetical protein